MTTPSSPLTRGIAVTNRLIVKSKYPDNTIRNKINLSGKDCYKCLVCEMIGVDTLAEAVVDVDAVPDDDAAAPDDDAAADRRARDAAQYTTAGPTISCFAFTDKNDPLVTHFSAFHKSFLTTTTTPRLINSKVNTFKTNHFGNTDADLPALFRAPSNQQHLIALFAKHCYPFVHITSPEWKDIQEDMKIAPFSRYMLKKKMFDGIDRLSDEHFRRIKKASSSGFVYLTVDAGTKWRRYLIVILHVPGVAPVILELLDERHLLTGYTEPATEGSIRDQLEENLSDDEQQEAQEVVVEAEAHTKTNLSIAFNRICEYLFAKRLCVLSITTDNCAAFVGAVPEMKFGSMHGRCLCHGLDLVVKLLTGKKKRLRDEDGNEVGEEITEGGHTVIVDALKIAAEFVDNICKARGYVGVAKIGVKRIVPTRWSTHFEHLESIRQLHGADSKEDLTGFALTQIELRSIIEACNILGGYRAAMNIGQLDDANQIDSSMIYCYCGEIFYGTILNIQIKIIIYYLLVLYFGFSCIFSFKFFYKIFLFKNSSAFPKNFVKKHLFKTTHPPELRSFPLEIVGTLDE